MAKVHTSFTGPPTSVSKLDQDLDRYITDAPDGKLEKYLAHVEDWNVFYNLTNLRTGLLAWYDFPEKADVLEIGAGVGALTGMLCERVQSVSAVESSMFKARTISKRYMKYDNLDIYAGDLPDLHIMKKFDLIILVDILPRIADGSTEPKPYIEYLEMLRGYLKLDGKILIAMDNRFALKFFCGARNPYTEEPFGELSGAQKGAHLFSREEISFIIREAGFPFIKFFYPLPDYRLPSVVYTDEMLPKSDMNDYFFSYDPTSDTRVLQENELYMDIIDNGAFSFMANSFLIECSRESNLSAVDMAIISSNRGPTESSVISISKKKNQVLNQAVFKVGEKKIKSIAKNMEELYSRGIDIVPIKLDNGKMKHEYIMGNNPKAKRLSTWFTQTLPKDKEKVLSIFDRLWASILQSSAPAPDTANALLNRRSTDFDWGVILKKAFLSMVPSNIIYDEGRLIFFNQEFVKENYPAKYPMFRAIFYSYLDLEAIVSLDELKARYGLSHVWPIFLEEEKNFVESTRNYELYHQLYSWSRMDEKRMFKNRQILKIIGNE